MPRSSTCESCHHFWRDWEAHMPDIPEWGEYRAHPPVPQHQVDGLLSSPHFGIWPIVRTDDWCSEYKDKYSVRGDRRGGKL